MELDIRKWKNHQQFRDDGGEKLLKSELQLPSSGNLHAMDLKTRDQ